MFIHYDSLSSKFTLLSSLVLEKLSQSSSEAGYIQRIIGSFSLATEIQGLVMNFSISCLILTHNPDTRKIHITASLG